MAEASFIQSAPRELIIVFKAIFVPAYDIVLETQESVATCRDQGAGSDLARLALAIPLSATVNVPVALTSFK